MDKAHVAVLMGGTSLEHDVSLCSGANAVKALENRGYRVTAVTIAKDGRWHWRGDRVDDIGLAVSRLRSAGVECVFIALHGPFGEDGRLQGLLDLAGLPYTGSGHAASAVAMDKVRSKAVVSQAGVRVGRQLVFDETDARGLDVLTRRVELELGFPCAIKSPCQGSSLGMGIPKNAAQFRESLPGLFALDPVVMAEEFLSGPEVTCGVLDVETPSAPIAMPVTEIRPVDSEYFDYRAKYTPGACREITPAEISEEAARRVQAMALRVHAAIGCRGFSRSDMILVNSEPVWLEVNTIPGMTETSLFPQAAAAVGISLADLVEKLVQKAMGTAKAAVQAA